MGKINVDLYGGKGLFGGKESPLETDVIFCDNTDSCDLFKQNKCLNCRAAFTYDCKYGQVSTNRGYTSRAAKYGEFRNKYTSDPEYHKLKYPHKRMIALIGEYVWLKVPFLKIRESVFDTPFMGSNESWISKDDMTPDFIKRICDWRPRTLMDDCEIKEYQAKTVTEFLMQLKRYLPDAYAEFIKQYPNYERNPDYVGKRAFLRSLKECDVKYIVRGRYMQFSETWHWNGETLKYVNGHIDTPKICPKCEVICYEIKPDVETVIEITSNDQVDENTEFDEEEGV